MKYANWGLVGLVVVGLSMPVPLYARERKIRFGDAPEKLTFKDIHYLPRTLEDLGSNKACVIVFTTTTCPLAQRYLPRLNELYQAHREQGVQFLAMNVGPDDSLTEVAWQAIQQKVEFPFVKDFDGSCARTLGVERTPEVVILDSEHKLRYRGRIDNQYRLGGVKPKPDSNDLKDALAAVLSGQKVRTKETAVDGCPITFAEPPRLRQEPTYAEHIAPLLNRHCVECHRPGTAAPFELTSYEKARARARSIAEVVEEQRMPPWFAHPEFGKFINYRGLTAEERATIVHWARGEKAPGDLARAPEPPRFPEHKWSIGEPDLIITAAQPEKLPATGFIPYRYVMLPYVFPHDTWVQRVEIMPGNPRVVHHANLGHVSLAQGFDVDRNFITGKVPGGIPAELGPGVAFMIPKGSGLVLQVHYVTTGKEESDQISVGLRYSREPVRKRLRYKIIADYKFQIPPGAPAWPVGAKRELECDATGVGLFSHMHLRGKDTTFYAHYPDGKTETLLALPNYSFDWQLSYVWGRGQQRFPKGTKMECLSHFDNSTWNPYNPDPKATIRNGPQTHDEMMQGFFFYTDDSEELNIVVDPKTGKEIKQAQEARSPNAP